jgi:disulfide bond formation protein DsbB
VTSQTVITFLALLGLFSLASTVLIAVGAVVLAVTGGPDWLASLRHDVGRVALPLATLVAATATLGSLWFSEYMGYVPCVLCWGQRIFMYSLAVVLTVGAVRNDRGVRAYGIALALPGAAIGIYHSWLQAYPRVTSFCTLDAPCAERFVWEFGFVSIPLMATSGFMFIIALLLIATPASASRSTSGSEPTRTSDQEVTV